jgi:hypothetical protein
MLRKRFEVHRLSKLVNQAKQILFKYGIDTGRTLTATVTLVERGVSEVKAEIDCLAMGSEYDPPRLLLEGVVRVWVGHVHGFLMTQKPIGVYDTRGDTGEWTRIDYLFRYHIVRFWIRFE